MDTVLLTRDFGVELRPITQQEAGSPFVQNLLCAHGLWVMGLDARAASIGAAVDALAQGFDGQLLRDLAGRSLEANPFEIASLTERSLGGFGLDVSEMTKDDATILVFRQQAVEVLMGVRTPRAFAQWAFDTVGDEAGPPTSDIVSLSVSYDLFDAGIEGEPDGFVVIDKFIDDTTDAAALWFPVDPPR